MDQDELFTLIKKNILLVLPELSTTTFKMDDSLRNLGANSIDRMEIIVQTMSDLKVKIPLVKFAQAKNIREIIAVFNDALNAPKTSA